MIRRMAVKVAELSDRKNDVDIIEYGLEAIFNGFLNMTVIILVGVVFHATSEAGIFLIMNIIGNGTFGGYHCNSLKCCMFFTGFNFILVLKIQKRASMILLPHVCMTILFCFILVILNAPSVHENKPLSKEVFQKNRKASIFLDVFLDVLIIMLYLNDLQLAGTLLVVKLEIVISMLLGKGVSAWKKSVQH